jgi:alkanesulfonate monooxygenase SsuD/methylene tetrahydromethanopterin reductase-like flavin-dependent oxidoreductase (luciferase family)
VRKALAREPLEHHGEAFTLPLDEARGGVGLGKPLKLLAKPVSERVPIYLGAIGPKALEQTGEIADGWLPFLFNPAEPEVMVEPVRRGAERAGRSLADVDVSPVVPVAVDEDPAVARAMGKPWLAFYLGAMGAKSKNFYVDLAERYGFGDSARACQERALAADRAGAVEAISDELIDAASICCAPNQLPDRLAAYAAAGADSLVAVPTGDKTAVVRALSAAATVAGGQAVG